MTKFNPSDHLMKLKGKDYLPVAWRLVWFREQWPHGIIETEPLQMTDTMAVFRATVTAVDEDGTVRGKATGTKAQTKQGFADYIEKSETGSIGRALAALGFGTQFDPELDEGERLADAPVERPIAPQRGNQAPAKAIPDKGKGSTITGPTGVVVAEQRHVDISGKPASEAAFKRMYAILAEHQLNHRHLHAYAVAMGHESSKQMTTDELKKLADGLKDKTDVAVTYLTKLANDIELAEANAAVNAQLDGSK